MPLVDVGLARRVAPRFAEAVAAVKFDTFTDTRYYPPLSESEEKVAMYFLVMVAMDHRLSRPGRPYEAVVDGKLYHGADLLYRLGMKRYEEDPHFFAAERLSKVTERDIVEWLCVEDVCPPDAELRAALLRDLGRKLEAAYGGSALRLLEASRGFLHTWDPSAPGLVERLRIFEAYSDPVEKKAMLLAKFLERRGLLEVRDPWNKRVPVDNHLTRIALRLGLVKLEAELMEKVRRGVSFTPWEDVLVRVAVREAWHAVAEAISVDDFLLDDVLWTMGRKLCVHGTPMCRGCKTHEMCSAGSCRLVGVCPVGLGLEEPVEEHTFLDTWWY